MTDIITFRQPDPADGAKVWALIEAAGSLDVNSVYCYVLLCDYFRDTCVLAEMEDRLVGFVSAFIDPGQPETLFVWQIAVDAGVRSQRIGSRMLEALITPLIGNRIRYIETTISPDNRPSRALFNRFAAHCRAEIIEKQGYPKDWFPVQLGHEEERLYRIGPLVCD